MIILLIFICCLDEGKKSTIDKIEVTGNTSTKDYVIVRELRIEPGEVYSQVKVENLPSRLNKLRFFDPVPVPSFYIDSKNSGVLQIKVKERNTNNFDGVIGYIPPQNENESGYVTGLVNITLRNIFGTGRAAANQLGKTYARFSGITIEIFRTMVIRLSF